MKVRERERESKRERERKGERQKERRTQREDQVYFTLKGKTLIVAVSFYSSGGF